MLFLFVCLLQDTAFEGSILLFHISYFFCSPFSYICSLGGFNPFEIDPNVLLDAGACTLPLARNLGLSYGGAWAKAFGQMLNFNCALVLYPILRYLLRKCNNFGSKQSQGGLSSWLPLHRNIDFHKLIGFVIGLCSAGHVIAHFINYGKSPDATVARFSWFAWLTGALITFSMLIIFSGGKKLLGCTNLLQLNFFPLPVVFILLTLLCACFVCTLLPFYPSALLRFCAFVFLCFFPLPLPSCLPLFRTSQCQACALRIVFKYTPRFHCVYVVFACTWTSLLDVGFGGNGALRV